MWTGGYFVQIPTHGDNTEPDGNRLSVGRSGQAAASALSQSARREAVQMPHRPPFLASSLLPLVGHPPLLLPSVQPNRRPGCPPRLPFASPDLAVIDQSVHWIPIASHGGDLIWSFPSSYHPSRPVLSTVLLESSSNHCIIGYVSSFRPLSPCSSGSRLYSTLHPIPSLLLRGFWGSP